MYQQMEMHGTAKIHVHYSISMLQLDFQGWICSAFPVLFIFGEELFITQGRTSRRTHRVSVNNHRAGGRYRPLFSFTFWFKILTASLEKT